MKTMNSKGILEELGRLLFLMYEGTDPKKAVLSEGDFIDVAQGLRHLRVLIKYQLYDLECCHRELDYLRKLLRGS